MGLIPYRLRFPLIWLLSGCSPDYLVLPVLQVGWPEGREGLSPKLEGLVRRGGQGREEALWEGEQDCRGWSGGRGKPPGLF